MARSNKDSTLKRTEILDAAQRLVFSKGYEQMTIQDILDTLQISKGAFYHYFSSKGALLEALVDRTIQEGVQVIAPIIEDPDLPALEKFQRFFSTAGRWKTAQKTYLIQLFNVWYHDDNALLRQKQMTAAFRHFTPYLTRIIRQGVAEGVFSTPFPDEMGEIAMSLFQGLADMMARLLLTREPAYDQYPLAKSYVAAYVNALERALGAPQHSLQIIDDDVLKEWFVPPLEKPFAETLPSQGKESSI